MLLAPILLLALMQNQTPADRARALISAGKMQEAAQALEGLDPSLPVNAHLSGVVRYNLHDYAAAARAFLIAIPAEAENSPAHRESVLLLARSLYLGGQPQDAIPWLEKIDPSVDVLFMLGNARLQALQPDAARAAFAKLFGVPPESATAHLETAQMMIRRNMAAEADEELTRALRIDPKIPQAHYLKGELAIHRAEFLEAIAELQKEIVLNPDFSAAYYLLGDAWSRREEWDRAIPQLQRSIWLNPFFSGPFILLGKAHLQKNDLANAEDMLRKGLRMDPDNASARALLEEVLRRMRETGPPARTR